MPAGDDQDDHRVHRIELALAVGLDSDGRITLEFPPQSVPGETLYLTPAAAVQMAHALRACAADATDILMARRAAGN